MTKGKQAGIFDKKEFQTLLRAFATTQNPTYAKALLWMCQAQGNHNIQFRSKLLELPFSQDEVDGEIGIGKVVDTNFTYGINLDDLTRHVFVGGAPGLGKTVMVKNILLHAIRSGVKVFIVIIKPGDFTELISEGVLYVPWDKLKFNLFKAPEGIDRLDRWHLRICSALAQPLGFMDASEGTLQNFVLNTFRKWEGKIFPCFKELADEILSVTKTFGKQGTYNETVQNRITKMNNELKDVFWCRRGYMDELMHQSWMLDISDLTGWSQSALLESILCFIYGWHLENVPKNRPRKIVRLVVVDEAQHTVMNAGKGRSDRNVATNIEQSIALSRECGLGYIATAQSPSKILPEIINDSFLRVTFGLGAGDEIRRMQFALGLTQYQAPMIQHLKVGEFIARSSAGFTFPALIQGFQAPLREPTEAEWEENERRVNELIAKAEVWSPDDTKRSEFIGINISENMKSLLKAIGTHPEHTMMELYSDAKLSNQTGNKAKDSLIKVGMIQEFDIPGAGSGKTKSAHITQYGTTAFGNLFQTKPTQLTRTAKAGLPHDWWCTRIQRTLTKQGYTVTLGVRFGNQEADIVGIKDNKKTAYEVTLSLSTIPQKVQLLEHVDHLAILYVNKTELAKIKKQMDIPKQYKDRVAFSPLKEFLV